LEMYTCTHKRLRKRLQFMYSALCCIISTNPLPVSWLTDTSDSVECTRRYDKETIRASPCVFTKRANSSGSRVKMNGDVKRGSSCSSGYPCYSKVDIDTVNAAEARPPKVPQNCMFIQPRHCNIQEWHRPIVFPPLCLDSKSYSPFRHLHNVIGVLAIRRSPGANQIC
jgi:hypothetical protein